MMALATGLGQLAQRFLGKIAVLGQSHDEHTLVGMIFLGELLL